MKKILAILMLMRVVGYGQIGGPIFNAQVVGGAQNVLLTGAGYDLLARGALSASVEFTRTNTVTAYISGDCISTNETTDTKCYPMTFENVVPSTGGGIVMEVRVSCSTGTATFPSELWLFNSTNILHQNDNAAFQLRWTNNAARLGSVLIPALSTQTGNDATHGLSSAVNYDARLAFNVGASVATNKNLYGYLVVKGAHTPAASEKYEVKIVVLGQ